MKTIRTLTAVILAAVLVLGPAVAFGATLTMTLQTNQPTYAGQSTIIVSGTVTPAPTISTTAVVITTKGLSGAVDIGEATVATGTGAFTYTLVSGGSSAWTSGTYTINGTWGAQGNTATKTTTFTYTGSGPTGSGGAAMGVTIDTNTPVIAGGIVNIGVLTSSPTGTLDDVVTWSPFHIHYPDGTVHNLCTAANTPAGCMGTFTKVHTGFYVVNFTLPATATVGGYFVHAGTTDANSVTGEGLGVFAVTSETSTQAQLTTIAGTIAGLQSSINVLTSSLGSINTGLQSVTTSVNSLSSLSSSLSSIQSSVNTISTGVTGITSTLSGLSNSLNTMSGISSQLTSLNNAINNNQTYVLVVAALAAITLVLELAILVRKLS
jgi:hypothetical protein